MIDVPRDDLVLMMEAGYIYLAGGKLNEAKQVFEGVSVLKPKHEIPMVAIANVLFAQKKFPQAIKLLKEALKINPKSVFALSHLGESLLFSNKKEEALKILNQAVALDGQSSAGQFARSLIKLIEQGYDPEKFRQEMKAAQKEAKE